jgi:hypothetical protein
MTDFLCGERKWLVTLVALGRPAIRRFPIWSPSAPAYPTGAFYPITGVEVNGTTALMQAVVFLFMQGSGAQQRLAQCGGQRDSAYVTCEA